MDNHSPAPIAFAPSLTAEQVLAKHNDAVAGLDKLWARTALRLRWKETDEAGRHGKVRREQAEGKLIVQRDAHGQGLHGTAVTAGKLGITAFWAGTDGTDAWLFDLRDERRVYITAADPGFAGRGDELPVPPYVLPWLLDMAPLEASTLYHPPEKVAGGYWEVAPVRGVRMLLDPRTGRAVRVTLADAAPGGFGGDLFVAHLEKYRPVTVAGLPKADRPSVPTRLDIYSLDRPAHILVKLDGMTDQRIKPAMFDLDKLMKIHKPARVSAAQGR